MSWFSVKTFFRTRATGRPKYRDKNYRAGLVAVEERIVIVRAKNGDAAIAKGRKEAARYDPAMNRRAVDAFDASPVFRRMMADFDSVARTISIDEKTSPPSAGSSNISYASA